MNPNKPTVCQLILVGARCEFIIICSFFNDPLSKNTNQYFSCIIGSQYFVALVLTRVMATLVGFQLIYSWVGVITNE